MSVADTVQAINPLSIVAGSLAFVGGLAWNDAIQGAIDARFPVEGKKSIRAKFIYALIITIIIVLLALFIKYVNDAAAALKNKVVSFEKTRELSQQYAR